MPLGPERENISGAGQSGRSGFWKKFGQFTIESDRLLDNGLFLRNFSAFRRPVLEKPAQNRGVYKKMFFSLHQDSTIHK